MFHFDCFMFHLLQYMFQPTFFLSKSQADAWPKLFFPRILIYESIIRGTSPFFMPFFKRLSILCSIPIPLCSVFLVYVPFTAIYVPSHRCYVPTNAVPTSPKPSQTPKHTTVINLTRHRMPALPLLRKTSRTAH